MNKTLVTIVALVFILSVLCIIIPTGEKVLVLNEILPVNPYSCIEKPIVFLAYEGVPYAPLNDRQTKDLFYSLNSFAYQKKASKKEIVHYGSVRFFADGRNIELLFSEAYNGSILVNDVDQSENYPIYHVSCGAEDLRELFKKVH